MLHISDSCYNNQNSFYMQYREILCTCYLIFPIVVYYKIQCYIRARILTLSQDTEQFRHHENPNAVLCSHIHFLPAPLFLSPLTTNLFSISIILLFEDWYTNGNIQCVTSWELPLLLLFSVIPFSLFLYSAVEPIH